MATWRISHGSLTNFAVVSLLFPFLNHRSSLKWPCLPVFRPGEEGGLERLLGWSSVTWKMARLPHQKWGLILWLIYGWHMALGGLINGLIYTVDVSRSMKPEVLPESSCYWTKRPVSRKKCQSAFFGWSLDPGNSKKNTTLLNGHGVFIWNFVGPPGQVAKWVHSNPLPAKISEAGWHKRWLQIGFWEFGGARHDCIH